MRIKTHKGIKGIIISHYNGVAVKTTMNWTDTLTYTSLLSGLILTAKAKVKDLDSTNELVFLRVRSKKYEIMVAPDKEYFLIVIQNPDEE